MATRVYAALALVLVIISGLLVMPSLRYSSAEVSFKTFDGNDKIDVSAASKQQLAKFSVEVAFRIKTAPSENGYLVSKGSSANGNNGKDQNYALYVTPTQKITGGFKAKDDTYQYLTSPAVSLNSWHIAKLTYDGTKLVLQLDGSTVATKSVGKAADNAGTTPLRIGANANVADNFFVGDMDYVKVIDKATSTTVYSNTFGTSSGSIDCSGPVKNLRGVVFIDRILSRDESGGAPDAAGYVAESMKYIHLNGFNAVRVPFYWESYVYNANDFMSEIELIVKEAANNKICVILDNHHYYTSSYWNLVVEGKSDGRGFPSFVVKNFPNVNGDYIQTAGPFWDAFLSNNFSVNGKKVWDVQFDFLSKIIAKVDGYSNVAGYEILNEPHLFDVSQYAKLGDYHTYMAKKIHSVSGKKIFFDRETTRGFSRQPSKETLIFPTGVSKVVYAPHDYSVPTPGSQGETQINNIKTWSTQKGTEVLIGEWGADNEADAVTFMKAFKANNFGWTAHSWKSTGSAGLGSSLYESSTVPRTDSLQDLVDAMATVY